MHVPGGLQFHGLYRPDIDGLRALAILPVLIFHAFPTIVPGGFIGVDIFFVISGFLISNIILRALERGSFSFAGFYANRIRRLFPALLLVLAACCAAGWFVLLPNEYEQLGKHSVGAVAYVENFVLWREAGYFDTGSVYKPLMHLWSLGVEEQFYLTYPLFLWLVWRLRRTLSGLLLAIAVASFSLNVWYVRHDTIGAFFLPQTRWWELMLGGLIASWQLFRQQPDSRGGMHWDRRITCLASRNDIPWLNNACSIAGILLIAVGLFLIHENELFPGWWALLPACGAALLIFGGPSAWINRALLATRPMVLIGLISYPLYLWHWPILAFPRMIRRAELSVTARIAGILLSFALAWVTWRLVEKPIRFGRKTWIKNSALVSASAMIGCFGYVAHQGGYIQRFPKVTADLGDVRGIQWATPECLKMVGSSGIDYCRVTSPAPPEVLLLGDSHAAVLYQAMASAYRERSQVLMNLGQAGCVLFYDTDTITSSRPNDKCQPAVNRILEFAATATSVRSIILSFRGPIYMSGHVFGSSSSAQSKTLVWKAAPKNTPQSDVFTGALRDTILRLYATGKNVIFFVDWPELGFDPTSCLPRPLRIIAEPPRVCGVPRAAVDARNRAYRQAVFDLKREFPNLTLFDPLPHLCDSAMCYAMKGEHPLYFDEDHPSNVGAALLVQKFFEEQSLQAPSVRNHSSGAN